MTAIAIADFDSNGSRDIAVLDYVSSLVTVFFNSGVVTNLSGAYVTTTIHFPIDLIAADLGSSPSPGVVIGSMQSSAVDVLSYQGAGIFSEQATLNFPACGLAPRHLATADLDGDGRLDIVTANGWEQGISVYLSTASGFAIGQQYLAESWEANPVATAAADFNGDGVPDLAVVADNVADLHPDAGRVTLLFNDGAGAFPTSSVISNPEGPAAIAAGDFNGDHLPDLVVGFDGSPQIAIYMNQGQGNFGAATIYPVPTPVLELRVGDLNGDGLLDIVGANPVASSEGAFLLINRGDGSFYPASSVGPSQQTTGASVVSVAIGDLDNDGISDLAIADTQGLSIWLNDCH